MLLLPFSGISIAEGVGLFKWTTVVVIGLWFLAVLLLESISVLRFDVTDVLVALFCASSSVSLILAGPRSDAASFLGAYASVFGVYFVVSRSVTTPKEAKRAVAALCVGLGVAGAVALLVPGAASTRQAQGLVRLGTIGTAGDPTAGVDRFGGQLMVAIVLGSPKICMLALANIFAIACAAAMRTSLSA